MRHAPPVSVHCGGGPAWRLLRVLLAALCAGATAAWALAQLLSGAGGGAPSWLPAGAASVAAAAAAGLAWRATGGPGPLLTWDGAAWSADGVVGRLEVMLDLGPWLLLRLRGDGDGAGRGPVPVRWLAVAGHEAGVAFHALRVAAYGAAGRAVPGAAADRPHV